MKPTRILKKVPRPHRDQFEVLALDPRDPDIVRAKRSPIPFTRESTERRAA